MVLTSQPTWHQQPSKVGSAGGAISAVRRKVVPLSQVTLARRPMPAPLSSGTLTPLRYLSLKNTIDTTTPLASTVALLPPAAEAWGGYTIVFDLDETLASNRNPCGPAVLRPHVRDMLQALKGKAEIVLWTASVESVGRVVLHQLDPDGSIFQHAIYRDRRWFREGQFFAKDLKMLGRDVNRTVIIENTPQCVRLQRENGIIVPKFIGNKVDYKAMLRLRDILLDLVLSDETVQRYFSKSPALVKTNEGGHPVLERIPKWQRALTEGNTILLFYPFYYRLKDVRALKEL